MKKTKKLVLAWILSVCLVAGLAGCAASTEQAPTSNTESAVTDSSVSDETAEESTVEKTALELLPEGGWETIPDTTAPGEAGTLQAIYKPKYAKGFSIEYYYGGAKVIATDIPATASTEAFSQRVLLLPEGATIPDVSYDHKIEGAVQNVVTFASSHAGHFSQVNATDLITGTSIKPESCFIPSLKQQLEEGKTKYVGSGSSADKELIASLQPQIVTVGGMATDTEVAKKLGESGIFCLYFGDFAEESFMGRAEWIQLVGALCGKDQEAQDILKQSEAQVNEIIRRVSEIEERPSVLWFVHSSQAPHWNVRTSSDYVNSMVSALGATMCFPPETTENSIKLSNEDFLLLMNQADKIVFGISLNSYPDAKEITFFNKEGQIDFAQSKAYQNGDCYVVGYDWSQDTANVADIMNSLAIALYPEEFQDLENPGKIIPFQEK